MKEKSHFILAGKKIIEPDYYSQWPELVDMFYAKTVDAKDLDLALGVIKQLNEHGIESAYDWLKSQVSWVEVGGALAISSRCCALGNDFEEYYSQHEGIKFTEFASAEVHQSVDISDCKTLDDVVAKLHDYEGRGLHAQATFNGMQLFSGTVTIDGAYSAITGMSKAEYEAVIGNAIRQMSYCQTVGAELISPTMIDEWNEFVQGNFMRANGIAATAATDILEAIARHDTWEEIKQMFDERGYSNEYAGMYTRTACREAEYFSGIDGIREYLLHNGPEPAALEEHVWPERGD